MPCAAGNMSFLRLNCTLILCVAPSHVHTLYNLQSRVQQPCDHISMLEHVEMCSNHQQCPHNPQRPVTCCFQHLQHPAITLSHALTTTHALALHRAQRPAFNAATPTAFRELTEACWHPEHALRPSFAEILSRLQVCAPHACMHANTRHACTPSTRCARFKDWGPVHACRRGPSTHVWLSGAWQAVHTCRNVTSKRTPTPGRKAK